MTEHPDRPPADPSSPFAWVWDDLVPRPRYDMGELKYLRSLRTNRGPIGLIVDDCEPPCWEWYEHGYNHEPPHPYRPQ
jgi:hypothetical protein